MRARLGVVVVAGVVLAATGCSDPASEPEAGADPQAAVDTTAVPEPVIEPVEVPDGEDFYAPPDPIPAGEHGDLLRYQAIEEDLDDVATYRIMYLSESLQGEPIVVTGTALLPQGDAPEGGWPVIAHSHGTTGLADVCAPSRTYPERVAELTMLASVADRYVIAATD